MREKKHHLERRHCNFLRSGWGSIFCLSQHKFSPLPRCPYESVYIFISKRGVTDWDCSFLYRIYDFRWSVGWVEHVSSGGSINEDLWLITSPGSRRVALVSRGQSVPAPTHSAPPPLRLLPEFPITLLDISQPAHHWQALPSAFCCCYPIALPQFLC